MTNECDIKGERMLFKAIIVRAVKDWTKSLIRVDHISQERKKVGKK